MLTLPNIKGDYNIKEITRNKLNKRTNSAFYKLKKLIIKRLNNRLVKALKYIKAEFLNIGYII